MIIVTTCLFKNPNFNSKFIKHDTLNVLNYHRLQNVAKQRFPQIIQIYFTKSHTFMSL